MKYCKKRTDPEHKLKALCPKEGQTVGVTLIHWGQKDIQCECTAEGCAKQADALAKGMAEIAYQARTGQITTMGRPASGGLEGNQWFNDERDRLNEKFKRGEKITPLDDAGDYRYGLTCAGWVDRFEGVFKGLRKEYMLKPNMAGQKLSLCFRYLRVEQTKPSYHTFIMLFGPMNAKLGMKEPKPADAMNGDLIVDPWPSAGGRLTEPTVYKDRKITGVVSGTW